MLVHIVRDLFRYFSVSKFFYMNDLIIDDINLVVMKFLFCMTVKLFIDEGQENSVKGGRVYWFRFFTKNHQVLVVANQV